MQARLLDPQGTPVNWVGNNEVEGLYGGHEIATASFLPRTNSDVIYFSLGRITSPAFHSLFDRQSDTAIDFPQGSILEQSTRGPDWRELVMPVPTASGMWSSTMATIARQRYALMDQQSNVDTTQ